MRRVPSHSYGASPATWDHTVLPAARHKWMCPTLTPASKLVLDLPTPEGWKAELTWATQQCTGRELNSRSLDHMSDALTIMPLSNPLTQSNQIFGHPVCLVSLVSIIVHCMTHSASSLGSVCSNHLSLPLLSRGHTTNKCWPTCVCQQCWQTKVCRVFRKLAYILCWPTMFAVYELVRFLLASKRQIVRCDWLAVVNIMTQNGRMHLTLTTLIILLHFTSTLSTTAPKQILGVYVFAYEQLNKSLLQQRRRRLLSPAISAILLSNKCCRVWHKCLPTNVVSAALVTKLTVPIPVVL